jgi:hypothetical protein
MSCPATFSTKTPPLLPRVADGGTTTDAEEVIPMAQPDALDVGLKQLVQSFADLSIVVNIIRESRDKAAPLRPALVDELRGL